MNLTLVGYRGTGKSTVAALVAARLGWSWVDADVQIESRAGMTIAAIFAEQGEPAFRELEAEVIRDLAARPRLVIAAGGGAVLRADNRRALAEGGKVVWLKAQPETILARLAADVTTARRRPNLSAAGGLEEIVSMLQRRTPLYRSLADLEIDTDGRRPEDIADEIVARLDLATGEGRST